MQAMTNTSPVPSEPTYVPIGVAARRLGVTPATVRNWHRRGKIAATRTAGGDRRFRVADVDALAAAGAE